MSTVIKIENLGKQYRLGEVGTGTLSHDLSRWWALVRGKEDPFATVGESNDRTKKGESEYVWALKDINFEVHAGEVLGIIGRNGAGKSTLLKILSKVTKPTTGQIKTRGRIASLLEVGTGFHPEMTGRENVFLNGAIMGMTSNEIKKKFDEIVDFSGVERYIDTPVKRYSSGMYVRLAFAVAAHLEPEILIVDEVLAVGDAEFQKKCLGKMKDVSVNDGRTVLFVSHNLAAVKNLTNKVAYLANGMLKSFDDTNVIVNEYLNESIKLVERGDLGFFRRNEKAGKTLITGISVNKSGNQLPQIKRNDQVRIELKIRSEVDVKDMVINLIIKNSASEVITTFSSFDANIIFNVANGEDTFVELLIKDHHFVPGKYFVTLGLSPGNEGIAYDVIVDYPMFEISEEIQFTYWKNRPEGVININENLVWNSQAMEMID